jgi:hypothetical protein
MKNNIIRFITALFVLSTFLTSCYGEMSGIVIDAGTGKPIEGAVVLVEWTKTKGVPGQTYHEVYKIVETETDKEGKFTVSITYNPLVDPPVIVIHKTGYVAWRNDYIFPGWEKRKHFQYQRGILINLEKWKEEYSYDQHHSFMGHGVIDADISVAPKFNKLHSMELRNALIEIEKKKQQKNK